MKKVYLLPIAFILSIFLAACGAEGSNEETTEETDEEKATAEQQEEVAEEVDQQEDASSVHRSVNWEDKVSEIAASDGTETEKHDEIMSYAGDYEPTDNELLKFLDYIIEEYRSGNYLSDVTDHEYMLENLFKARVVDKHFANIGENSAMSDFAFDFLQITKYTYRGAEEVDSDFVQENERQLDKSLEEMQ